MSDWKHNGYTFTGGNTYGTPTTHKIVGGITLTGVTSLVSPTTGFLAGSTTVLSDNLMDVGISESVGKAMMTTPKQLVSNDFKNSKTGEDFQIYYDGDSETHVWSKDGKITKMRHY